MSKRNIAIRKTKRSGWGGTMADSQVHANLFRGDGNPTHFGIMEAQMFSSAIDSNKVNKPWTYLTEAQGNVFMTDPGHSTYQWDLIGNSDTTMTITRMDSTTPVKAGENNTEFYIYVDQPWCAEPLLVKTMSDNAPRLRVIGDSVGTPEGDFRVKVKLQTGDPNDYIERKWLQPNMQLRDGGTSTANELNEKYAGDYYTSVSNLESRIGHVARKIEVTDKFIRLELAGKKAKGMNTRIGKTTYNDGIAFSEGYIYQPNLPGGYNGGPNGKKITKGTFISMAEARLADRLYHDCNYQMELGRSELTYDPDTGRQITVGPGWRQIRRDGAFSTHDGTLSLFELDEMINTRFDSLMTVGGPNLVMRTGRLGIQLLSRAINAEASASPFVLNDSYFIDKTSSDITPNALKWGAQFTEVLLSNGLELKVMYDYTKDNPEFYQEKIEGTTFNKESATFEILDLGKTDLAPSNYSAKTNIAMVKEEAYDEYYNVGNVYDIYTGAVNDGSKVASTSKTAGIYRAKSCGLVVFDTDRIFTMEME